MQGAARNWHMHASAQSGFCEVLARYKAVSALESQLRKPCEGGRAPQCPSAASTAAPSDTEDTAVSALESQLRGALRRGPSHLRAASN
eukprot:2460369-Alexandrium_andersonii.AAC.1